MQGRMGLPAPKPAGNVSQQLAIVAKKHYLPYQVQAEKDVAIIHYKDSIKQIIYAGSAYMLHRNTATLYDMTGTPFANPPKVTLSFKQMLRYILENKVNIAEAEPEQEEFGINTIEKIMLFVSHRPITLKDGVILRFGPSNGGIFVAKMNSQQLFYIGSLSNHGWMQVESRRNYGRTARCPSCTCVREGLINVHKEWCSVASTKVGQPMPSSTSRNETLPVFIQFEI